MLRGITPRETDMNQHTPFSPLRIGSLCLLIVLASNNVRGQDVPTGDVAGDAPTGLSLEQQRLSSRFERLEAVAARLAELAETSEPERAEQLRRTIKTSREKGIAERFSSIVALLETERLSAAAADQKELQAELELLLKVLLEDPGDSERDAQKKFLKAQIRELNKLIRQERSLRSQSEQGGDPKQLADKQGDVNDAAEKVERALEQNSESESEPSESKEGQPQEGQPQEGQPQEGQPQEGQPQEGQPQEGQPQEGQPQEGQPQEGQPQEGQPQEGQPQEGQSSETEQESADPIQNAANRVKKAREKMEQAEKKLRDAERRQAEGDQREAQRELEAARAELERILRQLREEEMEQLLTRLAARFREMLAAQQSIYDETTTISKAASDGTSRNLMLQSIRLSRRESELIREAEKALAMLREDGTSVAFPETAEQIADDMRSVATRLAAADVGPITQTVELDIIAGIKDMIEALDQARDELAQQQGSPPPPGGGGGEPGESPLVTQIAELKMIRTLQARVYKRTQDLGSLADNPQVDRQELQGELSKLAERQDRIFKATHDLETEANR
ncbi:hypothetical protein [Aeoliella sp. SH292]|uniref:hypothetical protein n=1 Tax=Aeoliella sp. SH292 TaxID=3454464 RepID=UPI003F94AC05